MKLLRLHISIILTMMLANMAVAQVNLNDIALDNIPYKKVRSYIEKQQQDERVSSFDDLRPTCQNADALDGFSRFSKTFVVKAALSDVWETYIGSSPVACWKTRKSAVGLVYNRTTDELTYTEDSCSGSQLGQVLFLNLRLIKGLYKLATAVEITDIQNENSSIEISYVDHGVNQGKQRITMRENEYGYTIITHTSIIKSSSQFRDKVLYPYFHNKLINSFHKNMRERVYTMRKIDPTVVSFLCN